MVRRSVFEKIFREMQSIHFRLDDLEKNISSWNPPRLEIPEAELFSLSDHLRKTYMTVSSRGQCDAIQVSSQTGRCRALESNYLNQLCRMGWLNKRKVSKSTYFYIAQEKTPSNQPLIIPDATPKMPNAHIEKDFRKFFAEP